MAEEEDKHIIDPDSVDVVEIGGAVGGGSFDVSIDDLGMMITNNSKEDLENFGGIEGLAEKLHVDPKNGLSQREADEGFTERREYFGRNTYKQPKGKTFLQLWLDALNDLTMIILIISAIVSIILAFAVPKNIGADVACPIERNSSESVSSVPEDNDDTIDGVEGFAILIAVVIVSTVTAGNNYSKEKKFRALAAKESDVKVKVRRDGQICEISIFDVNAGDIALVDTGSQVPADGVFLRGNNIQVDESQVNGETTPSKKNADNPFFVSGCKLTDGSGEFLVTSVGDNSQWGRIMAQLQTKDQETPLQQSLDGMAKLIGVFGITVAVLTFLVLAIWWLVSTITADPEYECVLFDEDFNATSSTYDPCNPLPDNASAYPSICREINRWSSAIKLVDFFITAVTIIVVAVPEGLPLAVTISLAYSMKQMFEDKNLVRKLKACETMSNCTNICSDKTGTLTENRMTVVGSWVAGNKWTSNIRKSKKGNDDEGLSEEEKKHRDAERRKKLFAEFDKQGDGCFGLCKKKKVAVNDSEGAGVEMDSKVKVDAPEYSDIVKDILDISFSMNSGQTSNFMVEKRKIDEDVDEVAELLVTTGNKTECALLMHLQLCGRNYRETREKNASEVYQTFPFASARKRMSTLMWKNREEGILRMHIKGAPEIIMGRSLYYLEDDGKGEPTIKALTQDKRDEMMKQLQDWAGQGLRTLCIGYRDFKAPTGADPVNPETLGVEGIEKYECEFVKKHKEILKQLAKEEKKKKKDEEEEENAPANVTSPLGLGPFDEPIACHQEDGVWKFDESPDSGIIIVALMGIEDPVRPEVPPAVELCQMAGVKIRMVTGDNIMTARSIARQCKILSDDNDAIEGPEFAKLTDDQIRERLDHISVIARCSPFDKQRLVQLLIGEGEVVAVTGDGTNDVLALKAADVGLAMGIRGTDIAKQASDIVILDDNFKSIVRSVMWGRNVYDNIRKFLQFQLTVNFAALFIVFIGAVADRGAPLKAIQLLWVNLIMDTLAALALGTEKPTGQLLNRKPFGRYDCLLSPHMIRFIIVQGLYQIIVLLVLLFAGNKIEFLGVTCAYQEKPGRFDTPVNGCTSAKIDKDNVALQTIIFNAFVYCQVFNEINARRVNGERNVYKGLFSNAMFVGIMLLIGLGQAILVVFTGQFMSVTPFPGINGIQWLASLVLAAITLPLGLLASFIPVPKRKPRKKLSEAEGCCCIKPVDYNAEKKEEEEEERKRLEEMKESHNKALLD